MAKKFRDLRTKMSPESQAKANQKAQDLLSGLPLAELRHAMLLLMKNLRIE